MENASKALIIAGAILLSIAIIGIGMYVYNQAELTVRSAGSGLSTQEIDTFNAEYVAYEGTQKGSIVRTLCDKIRTYNANLGAEQNDVDKIAIVTEYAGNMEEKPTTGKTTGPEINGLKSDIGSGKTYTISFGYDGKTGRVIVMGIQEGIVNN